MFVSKSKWPLPRLFDLLQLESTATLSISPLTTDPNNLNHKMRKIFTHAKFLSRLFINSQTVFASIHPVDACVSTFQFFPIFCGDIVLNKMSGRSCVFASVLFKDMHSSYLLYCESRSRLANWRSPNLNEVLMNMP
jgi:hypothetical protein